MSPPHDIAWQPLPEDRLVPYQATGALAIRSLLILAPHPDDEVFGCGGLIALAVAQGIDVRVVVVTDGAAGGDAALREQECMAAARGLGYLQRGADALVFWRLPDRGIAPDAGLQQRIADAIQAQRPDWLLVPSPFEIHVDHRAVCAAAVAACAGREAPRLGFYEVGQPLMPNCLIDVTAVIAQKQQAIQCFASQLAVQDYGEQVLALNRYRSYTLGPQVTHAEALHFVAADALRAGLPGVLDAVRLDLSARFTGTGRVAE